MKLFKSKTDPVDINRIRVVFHSEKGNKVKKWVDVPGLAVETESPKGIIYIRGLYGNIVARFKEKDVYCVVPASSSWSQLWALGEK